MVKIAFFEIETWEEDYIKKKLKGHSLKFFQEKLTENTVFKVKDSDIIATFINSEINKKVINRLKKVKLFTTMSTGFDHIDLKECKQKKITVCNVPSYGENTVAEHTFGLLLSISKKIIDSVDRTREGDFTLDGLSGFDLKGKTIGIIGTGKIGYHVAKIAKGFEMNIIAFDVYPNPKIAKQFGFKYVTLNNLLKTSDIVTLHVPLTKKTKYLLNKNNIKLMKKGVVLINTARGGLVETQALVQALNNKIIGYAGLDVLEDEHAIKEEKELLTKEFTKKHNLKTLLAEHMLLHYDNVYITPHNAFNSKEALERIMDTTIDNIKAFVKKKPINKVKI